MDIQKENNLIQEAFEVEADEIGFCLDQKWGDYENPYENSDTTLAFNLLKKGWQAAKAHEAEKLKGCVVVPVELSESIAEKLALEKVKKPRQENDVVWQEIADRTYRDRLLQKKWEIIRDYKELVEAAQEQSHV